MCDVSRKKPRETACTPALLTLTAAGVAHTVHEYEQDPRSKLGYGEAAACALGVDRRLVHKTLMVSAFLDGTTELVSAIVPADSHLGLKELAGAVGAKRAEMANQADAERATGYITGGISPIGQKNRHRTVLHEDALLMDSILVSGGRRGLSVELSPIDLVELLDAVVAPIARPGSRVTH